MHPWEAYQGIYLHIPFCQHKCSYCDFISYQGQDGAARARYVKALIREIRSYDAPLPVSRGATVYVGGGTPSLLSLEELAAIFHALKEKGYLHSPREVTFEANPGTVDEAYLRGLRALGVDRLSLGIQSLEDSELRPIQRMRRGTLSFSAKRWGLHVCPVTLSMDIRRRRLQASRHP